MLENCINLTLLINLELAGCGIVELLRGTKLGQSPPGGPVVDEFSANSLAGRCNMVDVNPELAELQGAGRLVLDAEVGALSSVPVEAPLEGGELLVHGVSNQVQAEGVLIVEVSQVTFSGVRSGINEPLCLNIFEIVFKANLELWGLGTSSCEGSAIDNGLKTFAVGSILRY